MKGPRTTHLSLDLEPQPSKIKIQSISADRIQCVNGKQKNIKLDIKTVDFQLCYITVCYGHSMDIIYIISESYVVTVVYSRTGIT